MIPKLNDVYRLQERFFKHYAESRLCPKVEHVDDWLMHHDQQLVFNALKYTLQEEANNPIGFIAYLLQHPEKIRLAPDPVKEPAISYSVLDFQQRLSVVGSIEVHDQDDVHRLTMDISDLDWMLGISRDNIDQQGDDEMHRLFWIYYQKDIGCTAQAASRVYCIVRWYPNLFGKFIRSGYADWLRRSQGGQSLDVEGSDFIAAPIAKVASML